MQKVSILVVEDEAIISLDIQRDLEYFGYHVAGAAYQGDDAIRMAEASHPDLVLMDINLGGNMDGIETAMQMRLHSNLPIVFLTGSVDDDTIQRSKAVEPYGYILKPYQAVDLRVTIEHAINKFQLETLARQSEARFRELFETSQDGILYGDSEVKILDANLAFQSMVGYSRAELLDMDISHLTRKVFSIDNEPLVLRQIQERGYSDEIIRDLWHKDGTRVPCSLRIWVRRDKDGKVAGIWSIIRDLTALQKSQIALQTSERRLRDLVDKSPDGISIVDSAGRVVEWNQSLEAITGLSPVDAIGQAIWDIHGQLIVPEHKSPDLVARFKAMIQAGLQNGDLSQFGKKNTREIFTLCGERKTVEMVIYPIREPMGLMLTCIFRDITFETAAERKIIRQQAFSQKMVKITEQLNAQIELSKVLEIVCTEIASAMEVDAAQVTLFNPEKDELSIAHFFGPPQTAGSVSTPYPLPVYKRFIDDAAPYLVIPDVMDDPAQGAYFPSLLKFGARTIVIVNLRRETQLIGSLDLATFERTRQFDQEELTFLVTLANHSAIAIDRARMYQQTKRRAEELEALGRLSMALRLTHNQREMMPVLLKEAVGLSQAEVGVIYLMGQAGNPIDSRFFSSLTDSNVEWVSPNNAQWAKALSSEDLVVEPVRDALSHPDGINNPIQLKVYVPFHSTRTLAALLVLGFTNSRQLDREERGLILSLAEMGGNALHRSGLMEMLEKRATDRTRELSALYDLTVFVNSPIPLGQMLNEALHKLVEVDHASGGAIFRYATESSSLTLEAMANLPEEIRVGVSSMALPPPMVQWLESSSNPWLAHRDNAKEAPMIIPGASAYETVINIPIRFEGITFGLLTVLWMERFDPTVEGIAFLSAVAERLGSAIQNDLLRQHSEKAAVLEERQRLARELHDSVTQSVYSLTLLAEAGKDLLARQDLERLEKCLDDLGSNSIQALKEMRMLLFELRPPRQGEQGLAMALRNRLDAVETRAGVQATLEAAETGTLSPARQEELYRVAIEALNNSLKHSGASAVRVKLSLTDGGVQMIIEDNGCGFDSQANRSGGMGLTTMHERVSRIGGDLKIESSPGHGTRVIIMLNTPLV